MFNLNPPQGQNKGLGLMGLISNMYKSFFLFFFLLSNPDYFTISEPISPEPIQPLPKKFTVKEMLKIRRQVGQRWHHIHDYASPFHFLFWLMGEGLSSSSMRKISNNLHFIPNCCCCCVDTSALLSSNGAPSTASLHKVKILSFFPTKQVLNWHVLRRRRPPIPPSTIPLPLPTLPTVQLHVPRSRWLYFTGKSNRRLRRLKGWPLSKSTCRIQTETRMYLKKKTKKIVAVIFNTEVSKHFFTFFHLFYIFKIIFNELLTATSKYSISKITVNFSIFFLSPERLIFSWKQTNTPKIAHFPVSTFLLLF